MPRKMNWQGITKAQATRVLRGRGIGMDDVKLTMRLAENGCGHMSTSSNGTHYARVTIQGEDEWDVDMIASSPVAADVTPELAASAYVADPLNPTDEELGAAVERGLADGSLIDSEDFLARAAEPAADVTAQAPMTEVAPNVVVIAPDALGGFLAELNSDAPAADIDRARTVTHRNGITQVFRTAQRDRAAGEAAIGAYQRYGDTYRTYAPDGSSLGTWATEAAAYIAAGGKPAPEPEPELEA